MIPPPRNTTTQSLADWAEFYVASEGTSLSKAKFGSLLESMPFSVNEEDVDGAFGELARREQLYGDVSPYQLDAGILNPAIKIKDCPEYLMCLLFSVLGARREKGKDDGTKLFERLSKEAALFYLGGRAEILGFPNSATLASQLKKISIATNERLGDRQPKPKDKDKGVDLIAWKPHGDRRDNQIVLLLQCGAGFHFDTKKQISLPAWQEFIKWSAQPVQGMIVPVVISADDWIETRDDYNLIFDRARIHRALYGKTLSDKNLRGQIQKWCKSRLKGE